MDCLVSGQNGQEDELIFSSLRKAVLASGSDNEKGR